MAGNIGTIFKNFGVSYVLLFSNFNPCGIFENMTLSSSILTQDLEQGKLMAAVNCRK